MMSAFIKAISYYLPKKILSTQELAEMFPEWTAEKIAGKVGIRERHIAADDETASDMAVKAAEKLFVENHIDKSVIDFVLLCTQSSDYYLPSSACIIQNKLGLSTKCGAFDFNLGCSGYEYGLAIAKGLIISGIAKNVLLLTSETYTKYINPNDKGNRTIFGDGASASLISTDGFAKLCDFSLGTDGSGAENLIVSTGCARYKEPKNDCRIDDDGNFISSDHLYMNGGAIFDFSSNVVPLMVQDLLDKHNLKQDDINLFVFHQANKYMINYLRRLLNIDKEKFFVFMENVGNTVSSTIPIALCEAKKDGKLKGNILLAGFGVGLSWGGCILKITE